MAIRCILFMSFPLCAKVDSCVWESMGCVPMSKTLPLIVFYSVSICRLDDPHGALILGEDLTVLGISLFRSINLDYDADEVHNIVIGIS